VKKLIAYIFIALAAMFLVACGGVPLTPDAPAAQGLMTVTKAVDPALVETRYCGSPTRDANGVITRRSDVIRAYWAQHVCPSTLKYSAPCPGWALNHVLPRACGGCDSVDNLIPMQVSTKKLVDAVERKINAHNPPFPDTAACPPLLVPIP
jgi:hypothetical protein